MVQKMGRLVSSEAGPINTNASEERQCQNIQTIIPHIMQAVGDIKTRMKYLTLLMGFAFIVAIRCQKIVAFVMDAAIP